MLGYCSPFAPLVGVWSTEFLLDGAIDTLVGTGVVAVKIPGFAVVAPPLPPPDAAGSVATVTGLEETAEVARIPPPVLDAIAEVKGAEPALSQGAMAH